MKTQIVMIDDDQYLCKLINESFPEFNLIFFHEIPNHNLDVFRESLLLVIDENLPNGLGIDFVKKFRLNFQSTPIILITSMPTKDLGIRCVNLNVTSFIEKPFSIKSFRLNVFEALGESLSIPIDNGYYIYPNKRELKYEEEVIRLAKIEYNLLEKLFFSPGDKYLSKEELVTAAWGSLSDSNLNSINTHLSNLKKKIGPLSSKIKNIRNKGFHWDR